MLSTTAASTTQSAVAADDLMSKEDTSKACKKTPEFAKEWKVYFLV